MLHRSEPPPGSMEHFCIVRCCYGYGGFGIRILQLPFDMLSAFSHHPSPKTPKRKGQALMARLRNRPIECRMLFDDDDDDDDGVDAHAGRYKKKHSYLLEEHGRPLRESINNFDKLPYYLKHESWYRQQQNKSTSSLNLPTDIP